ncbi:MAG: ParB/RepB/Spo0J family partition protein [Gallionellaceae bacterium]|jgi:ParB/RepB/Spo0J family partition protein
MNAPTPDAIIEKEGIQWLAITDLFPSPTNPRKRFDDGKLKELADSIKSQGVLQPILVRAISAAPKKTDSWPFPVGPYAKFEVVAGERRYRAAKLAGLIEMPCFVRELTDLQVLHAQVIENLQRDDLHPLEEADGYAKLMKDHGATADSLAAEIGKSKAYIYARLKFTDLCQEAREAFYQGELDASTALLIARIPVHKLQIQAVKQITAKADYNSQNFKSGDKIMSYRAAKDLLQSEYMTSLNRAIFDIKDANLINKIGACTDCVSRTGNQPELFDDVGSADVCTNTVCFAMKKTAHILSIQKQAEENGDIVIIGKTAKKLIPNPTWSSHPGPDADSGYAKLDSIIPGDAENRTWESALESTNTKVQKTLIENPHNKEFIPTVKIEDAIKALREAGFEITPKGAAKSTAAIENQKAQDKIKAKLELTQATRKRLFMELHNKIKNGMSQVPPYVPDILYKVLAETCFENFMNNDTALSVSQLYYPHVVDDDVVEILKSRISELSVGEQFLLCIDCLMSTELNVTQWNMDHRPDQMLAIAGPLCIDAKQIEKEVAAEIKQAKKAVSSRKTPPDQEKKVEAKTASTPTPAAQAPDKPAKKTKAAPAKDDWPFPVGAIPKTTEKTKRKAAVAA